MHSTTLEYVVSCDGVCHMMEVDLCHMMEVGMCHMMEVGMCHMLEVT